MLSFNEQFLSSRIFSLLHYKENVQKIDIGKVDFSLKLCFQCELLVVVLPFHQVSDYTTQQPLFLEGQLWYTEVAPLHSTQLEAFSK